MTRSVVSIKKLLSGDDHRVADMVDELEASRSEPAAGVLWTERLTASTKGGKCMA